MTQLCGLDEAGRGPLAGPLVAAAVILPEDFDFIARFPKIRFGDSKQLSLRQREAASELIRQYAVTAEVEVIPVEAINEYGIGWANKAIFERLISLVDADHYIVDGNLKLNLPTGKQPFVRSMIRADETVQAVSAASIIAKVYRDHIMQKLHVIYPDYHWNTNAGYYSRDHIAALRTYGLTPHHRDQFVATALSKPPKLPGFDTP